MWLWLGIVLAVIVLPSVLLFTIELERGADREERLAREAELKRLRELEQRDGRRG